MGLYPLFSSIAREVAQASLEEIRRKEDSLLEGIQILGAEQMNLLSALPNMVATVR